MGGGTRFSIRRFLVPFRWLEDSGGFAHIYVRKRELWTFLKLIIYRAARFLAVLQLLKDEAQF